MKELSVGVLGLQGNVEEHIAATKAAFEETGLKGNVMWVKTPRQVQVLDGLIIPGGESTVIGRLSSFNQTLQSVKERILSGIPALGTCAGLVMLAKKVYDRVVGETNQPILGVMDIVVERNSFGRQRESFEVDLDIPVLGEEKFRGVFIRAPSIREAGPNVKVLSKLNDVITAVKQDNLLGTAFHPELADDLRIHRYFLELVGRHSQISKAIRNPR